MIKNGLSAFLLGSLLACAKAPEGPERFQGVVELDERVLGFETGGRLMTLEVARGDVVQAGDLLASLDDSLALTAKEGRVAEAEAAKAQAKVVRAGSRSEDRKAMQAQIRAAKAREELLQRQVDRDRPLLAAGAIPPAAFDEIESKKAAATADREALEQRLTEMQSGARPEEIQGVEARARAAQGAVDLEAGRVERFRLRAITAGKVIDTHADPGEIVGLGTPVVTLADTAHPYVDTFVPEGRIGGLKVGGRAEVKVDSIPEALPGAIESIARHTEFTPRYLFSERERPALVIRVRVRIQDPKEVLHAGLPAFVRFEGLSIAQAGAP